MAICHALWRVPYFGVGVADHLVDGRGVVLREAAQLPHLLAEVAGLLLQTAQLVVRLGREVQVWRTLEGEVRTGHCTCVSGERCRSGER